MNLTPTTLAADNDARIYGNHLRLAAVLAIAFFWFIMWLVLDDPEAWVLAVPFVLPYPYIAIVPRRKESLAWAQALGWVYLVLFACGSLAMLSAGGTVQSMAKAFAVTIGMVLVQIYAIFSARRVGKAGRILNRITGTMTGSRVFAILYSVFWIFLAAVAVPGLIRSREAANEASAVGTVRAMNTALTTYKTEHGALPGKVTELSGLLDEKIACAEPPCKKAEYRFTYTPLTADASGPRYVVIAQPVKYGNNGMRSFFSDESGVIRFTAEDRQPTVKDIPLQ